MNDSLVTIAQHKELRDKVVKEAIHNARIVLCDLEHGTKPRRGDLLRALRQIEMADDIINTKTDTRGLVISKEEASKRIEELVAKQKTLAKPVPTTKLSKVKVQSKSTTVKATKPVLDGEREAYGFLWSSGARTEPQRGITGDLARVSAV